jgi:hypothetical protein
VVLVSLTFGNVEVTRYLSQCASSHISSIINQPIWYKLTPFSCLRNAVSLFHIIETEMKWRQSKGKAPGFEALKAHKPLLAVGAEEPLEDQKIMADYFRKCSSKK